LRDMNISENIRALALDGITVAEIARRLGIRYQHAYNVLKVSGMLPISHPGTTTPPPKSPVASKPPLPVAELMGGGFEFSGRWILSDAGDLIADRPLPKAVGVYAFAKNGIVVYVGVATMGLAKRL
jgi:hypothetical protein